MLNKISDIFNKLRKTLNPPKFILHFNDGLEDGPGDKDKPDFSSVMFMEKNGRAFGRVSWYHDDGDYIYLDSLSVTKSARNRGIGTTLQVLREKIGINLGAKYACLYVKGNSWMHDWYLRRGYEFYKDHDDYSKEENMIWLRKTL